MAIEIIGGMISFLLTLILTAWVCDCKQYPFGFCWQSPLNKPSSFGGIRNHRLSSSSLNPTLKQDWSMPGHTMPKSHQGILYTRYSSPPQKPIDRPTKPGQRPIFFFVIIRRQHPFFFQGEQKKRTQSGCLATVFLKIKIGGNIYIRKRNKAQQEVIIKRCAMYMISGSSDVPSLRPSTPLSGLTPRIVLCEEIGRNGREEVSVITREEDGVVIGRRLIVFDAIGERIEDKSVAWGDGD